VGSGDERQISAEVEREGNDFVLRDRDVERGVAYRYQVIVIDDGRAVTSFEASVTTPKLRFALGQNQPNPFNPTTRIDFSVEHGGVVTLRVYDIAGRLVRTLVAGSRAPGAYTEHWDGRSDSGERVASGIYFYRLESDRRSLTRKAVLLR
jgi:flagellar hook assembly protein FlgD